MTGQLDWLRGGIALGLVFLLAVVLVKPIGVSTQFVIVDGILWSLFSDDVAVADKEARSGWTSANAYLAKSGGKYAKAVTQPLSYGLVFVIFMAVGSFLSARTGGPRPSPESRVAPAVWRSRFGSAPAIRYAAAFAGGVLVLFGARLAGGCTSGHMMSGMMQTSVSGYLFAVGAFAAAIPVARLLYPQKGDSR